MKTHHIQLKNNFTPYPQYKDSGIEWIGEIPVEWGMEKLKFFSIISLGKMLQNNNSQKGDAFLKPYLRAQNILWGKVDISNINTMWFSADELLKHRIQKDDLLVSEGGEVGRTAIWKNEIEECYVQNSINRVSIKKNKANPTFVLYAFEGFGKMGVFNLLVNRVSIAHLTMEKLKEVTFPFPSLKTQQKIAKYLDEKTVLIDKIIEKKKKLIVLLREKRTALINQSVNDGKGENVKIKHCVATNPSKRTVSLTDMESAVSFVPMEAISNNGELILQERKYKDVKDGFTYFENEDVVLAKITPCYENGKAGVMKNLKNDFGFGTTEFIVLRPSKRILPKYLYFLIFSDKFRKLGEVEMRGTAGQKRVTNTFIRNYEFVLPSLKDQEKIVEILNEKTKLMDKTFEIVEQSIKTLQEFKSSLISNVVTGKVMDFSTSSK